ncbi:MAG TPA: hypothetical protein DCS60_02705 [Opitutae bacterium]|nr:hypothetical protein [Opitutae bacterium]
MWSGEFETAIAGGVNVMLWPEFPIVTSAGKCLFFHSFYKVFD